MRLFHLHDTPLAAPAFTIEYLHAWVHGWTRSRATPAAIDIGDRVLKVEVGLPGHMVRYVMPGHEHARIKHLAQSLDAPGIWLKIFAPTSAVAPLLPRRWTLDRQNFFMHTRLAFQGELAPPRGYALTVAEQGEALAATLMAADGQIAAQGHMAAFEHFAIFDRIQTDAAHRRKGLGKFLMQALANRALSGGAVQGLLVATDEGKELYRRIGWDVVCPVTSAYLV